MEAAGVRRVVWVWAMGIVLALAGPVRAQSDTQLVDRFDKAEAAGQYKEALVAAQAIVQRHPTSAFWAFNAARMHARLGQADEAIALLRKSADAGFTGISSFEEHADLDTVRARPEFAAIVATVRANAAKRMVEFQAEAKQHTHPVFKPRNLPKGVRPGAIIALHGSGGTGAQMVNACKRTCTDLGLICIAPDAVRQQGTGFSWTYRDEAAWLVEHMVREAIEKHGADPERIYLVGFSQGANIALVMARSHAGLFAGVVPVCGHYEPGIVAKSGAGKAPPAPPMYLVTGAGDAWKQTYEQAERDFEDAGGAAEVRIVPGMGHSMVSPAELRRALEWCIAGEKAPAE
jgi:predicted esterase